MPPTDGIDGRRSQNRVRDEEKQLEDPARHNYEIDDEKAYLVTWDEHDPEKSVCPLNLYLMSANRAQSSQLVDAVSIMAYVPIRHAGFGCLLGIIHNCSG